MSWTKRNQLAPVLVAVAIALANYPAPSGAEATQRSAQVIQERHDLMEKVGEHAKTINIAVKSKNPGLAAEPAEAIAGMMDHYLELFPPDSTGPGSRARPEIWTEWDKFESLATKLKGQATALAAAARSGGDLRPESSAMFQLCKKCHASFRVPKDGE
jgi:cytochrome c556